MGTENSCHTQQNLIRQEMVLLPDWVGGRKTAVKPGIVMGGWVVHVLYVGGGQVEGVLARLANVSPMCSFTFPRNKEPVNHSSI